MNQLHFTFAGAENTPEESNTNNESLLGEFLVHAYHKAVEANRKLYRSRYSEAAWEDQFGTIDMKLPRRSGKTSAIVHFVKEVQLPMYIVTPVEYSRNQLMNKFKDAGITEPPPVYTKARMHEPAFVPLTWDTKADIVILDGIDEPLESASFIPGNLLTIYLYT